MSIPRHCRPCLLISYIGGRHKKLAYASLSSQKTTRYLWGCCDEGGRARKSKRDREEDGGRRGMGKEKGCLFRINVNGRAVYLLKEKSCQNTTQSNRAIHELNQREKKPDQKVTF